MNKVHIKQDRWVEPQAKQIVVNIYHHWASSRTSCGRSSNICFFFLFSTSFNNNKTNKLSPSTPTTPSNDVWHKSPIHSKRPVKIRSLVWNTWNFAKCKYLDSTKYSDKILSSFTARLD